MNIKKVIENLKKNNFKPYFIESKEELIPLLKEIICKDETVSVGGSVTLNEAGVLDFLRNGDYNFLDRYAPDVDQDEIFRKSFFADTYIMSSNAVLEDGSLFNVDGYGNRVAALIFGPKSVIVVVGINKIVKNFDEAVKRTKTIAAPLNAKRLNKDTYCNLTGKCVATDSESPCDGCMSDSRICCNYVLSGRQMTRLKDRIKVIIVNEELGY
jgi:L-lactate utilization protein LutB